MPKTIISYDKKTEEERKQIYRMYQDIFEDPKRFARYYFSLVYPKNRVLKLEQNGQLASMVHLNPYLLVLDGKQINASYIVAVSTYKAYRRQGMMAALLKKAFEDLKERGELFTYLIPADEAYYTPFDFAFIMDWHQSEWEEEKGTCKSEYEIRKVSKDEYEKCAAYLNQCRGEQFSLWVHADASYIKQQEAEMESENGGLYFIQKKGIVTGFFACTLEDNRISCTNLWLPEEMRQKEFSSLLFQKFGRKKIEVVFGNKREDWGQPVRSVPTVMARILNLEELLKTRKGKKKRELCLSVEDQWIEENQGCFLWQISKEGSQVKRTDQRPEWTIGIGMLTKILFGYGEWGQELEKVPENVLDFLKQIEPIFEVSITEQV